MKTKMNRTISILVALMMLASFAFTAEAEDAYDHIGFDYMGSAYAKGDTEYLTVTAYDADNDEVTFEEDLTYASSNENVVTVDANGLMTAVDYGVATVTATYGNLKASMLVTVTNNTINAAEGGAAPSSHSTDLVRSGAYSYKLQGGTDTSFSDGTYAKINSLVHPWNTIPANAVIYAWFYDNGESSNSEAGVYMSPYSNNANGTRVVGILSAADTTYKVSEKGARLSQTNNNWNQGNKYGVKSDVIGSATNTGIQRTKGWHQVAFVRKNADASATMTDSGSAFPKSTVYKIYFDGQEVYTETADRAFVYLYGYAGFNSSNYAYIADPSIHSYIGLDDVALTENSGAFTLGYHYYGTSGTQTPSYKWQVSSNGATGWTDIAGETGQTFTPSMDYQNKYIRGGVKVATSGVETGYQFSEAESIVIFDGTYDSISLGKNNASLAKGATGTLSLTGYRYGHEFAVSDLSGAVFSSDNEGIVTVTNAGVVTAVDYGVATITATYGDMTASMLIHVTNGAAINANEGGAAPSSHSTDLVRSGAYSYKLQGGTNTSFSDGTYAKINSLLHPWNTIPANAVINAWFYDNGESTDSEAGVYMSPYSNNANGTRVVGILSAADTTYKVSEKGARLSQTNNNWNQGNYYGVKSDVIGSATNTGIQRTKGWHQVSFVRKNADASATMTDSGSAFPKSTVYKIYLDGQEVYTETADRAFVYLYGYAGFNSSNYAYIADPTIYSYIGLDDVALTENSGTFTLGYHYYGTSGTQTPSYKWQVSDNGTSGWTDIAGETGQTFTPSMDYQNKYIRGGVRVTTSGVETGYQFSEPENIFIFDGTYDSISLGKNNASLTKGGSATLSLTGYRYGHEFTVSDLSGATFASGNEGIVTVTNAGVVTAVDYGVATVTATYGDMTASLLVTVTNSTAINAAEGGAAPSSHSTDLVRSGAYSYKLQGGTDTSFSDGAYAKINSLLHQWNTIPANAVINAWFYDNGESTDSEAGVYMSPYSNNANGTRVVGILSAADTTYKVSEKGARLSQTNNNWNEANNYGVKSDVIGSATNTGIQRTIGWHQVSFVRKNADASATMTDKGSSFPKSTVYKIYLDGQEVYTETADRAFVYLYGYAGFNSSNYAYIADPSIHQYIDAEASIAEDNGTFTASYSYYGTTGTKTPSYKWQVSSNGETGWTDISGATGQTFTPSNAYQNKYIRCGVKVSTANATMDSYRFSEPVNFFQFDGTYDSISLGKSTASFTKGTTGTLSLLGYRYGHEFAVSDLSGAVFTSNNEGVVTVTNAGVVTAVDYGVATVTATYGGKTASMLLHVTNGTSVNAAEGGAAPSSHSTDLVRNGSYSYKLQGGTNTSFSDAEYAKINSILHQWNTVPANAVINVWFYDNGLTSDSEVAVYTSAYSMDANGTKAVGIIDASDSTYKLTGKGTRRSQTNGNWNEGNHVGVNTSVSDILEDTGIQRTIGWHQVTFVRKNTDASATVTDQSASFPKSTACDIYLDGQLVDRETGKDRAFVYLYAYAGFDSGNYAYVADPSIYSYIDTEVSVTEANGTFAASYSYYGTAGTQTPSYKWQVSDDGTSGWTDIAGATASTYTPAASVRGKYIRAAVSVSVSGASVGWHYSKATEVETSVEYRNGSVYINSAQDIDDAVLIIAEYQTVGSFVKLISARFIDNVDVTANVEKTVSTGTIAPAGGNTVKILLWEGLSTQKALASAITVQ